MKILIIDYRYPNNPFHITDHECIVCDLKNALMSLLVEEPQIVLAFVEYCTEDENKTLLEDVKRSLLDGTKFVRLGFLEDRKFDDEFYLQLPYSKEDFSRIIDS